MRRAGNALCATGYSKWVAHSLSAMAEDAFKSAQLTLIEALNYKGQLSEGDLHDNLEQLVKTLQSAMDRPHIFRSMPKEDLERLRTVIERGEIRSGSFGDALVPEAPPEYDFLLHHHASHSKLGRRPLRSFSPSSSPSGVAP